MLLENHLEQISLSATAITELPFPPPKVFTNALVHTHDITALIRDTEAHERALFTDTPMEPTTLGPSKSKARKSDFYGLGLSGEQLKGGDVLDRLRKGGAGEGRDRGDVNVDILLKGAEKLCKVYPIDGAEEKILTLRTRHEQLSNSIAQYEARVAKQALQLDQMNHPKEYAEDIDPNGDDGGVVEEPAVLQHVQVSAEDFKREEEGLRELEKKKRGLEDQVSGMDRDLGGLMRRSTNSHQVL